MKKYYYKQQLMVQSLELMEKHEAGEKIDTEEEDEDIRNWPLKNTIAIYGSLIMNVILFGANVYNAIASDSLSILAASVDSFLDLMSSVVVWITEKIKRKPAPYEYPAGKSRIEPIALIIFSSCMFTATIFIIIEAVQGLISDKKNDIKLFTYIISGAGIGIKLIAFLYCRTIKSPSIQTLALDHFNDVVLNLSGVSGYLMGHYIKSWIDPSFAIGIGFYIMISWARNAWSQVKLLSGKTASPEFISKIIYLAWNHSKDIKAIDTVRAFHFGEKFLVEVDVVLSKEMTLGAAHDIGEGLQQKIENLEDVDRAFVHLDYETQHKPTIEHKTEFD